MSAGRARAVAVFAGPSLPGAGRRAAARASGLDLFPPAARGDVARAAGAGYAAIGLIDGAFGGRAAVAHKEILWALARGAAVVGAASMGALRAAELRGQGMAGTGTVFRLVAAGLIQGDDEVAVVHGPEELGFEPLSEALVDVRATLAAAVRAGALGTAAARALARLGAARHFRDRTWRAVLADARAAGLPAAALDDLRAWLPSGAVSPKREDAADLVARLARGEVPAPGAPAPPFEATAFAEELLARARNPFLEGW